MEELRIKPCINACAADTDRKVALEDNTLRMSICTYFRELSIKMILHEAPEIDFLSMLLAERSDLLLAVLCISLPL